jgi:hypothetical protein
LYPQTTFLPNWHIELMAANSLHAQRDACEAYVKSQASPGWKALRQRYDDPAYAGGKLQRLGHGARLMPSRYVRPYSKGQKNDF